MKKRVFYLSLITIMIGGSSHVIAQQKNNQQEVDRAKIEHAQIGIDHSEKSNYKHTTHPGAQWFPKAGFGMFIHWGISSVKEFDLSWPMMAGTSIIKSSKKHSQEFVDKFIAEGDFFAGNNCKNNNSCVTPNQYWALAKDFNPQSCDMDTWVKLAKEASMEYVVFTTRHHDGYAMWPSKYGDFNTKNYLGGRDFVKEFVTACRKYGLKIGLYYSGPDWFLNKDYQSFLYHGIKRDYANVPAVDADLKVRTTEKTAVEKQKHYEEVAAYLKGQVEELLTNYGKIDMIWFDGGPDIPKGNIAREHTITMERIHQLQPGIVTSPRFFGYGDFKTLEGDKDLPETKLDGWAELCVTINGDWGYTKAPVKSTAYMLNQLAICRSSNANLLLNFGPTKEGVLSNDMVNRLQEITSWMKINKVAVKGVKPIADDEQSSVPATASGKHRYLFVMPDVKDNLKAKLPAETVIVTFKTDKAIKHISILGKGKKVNYTVEHGVVTIQMPPTGRAANGDVIDMELK